MKTKLIFRLILTLSVVLSFTVAENSTAQKILVQTGFEEFTVNKPPKDWEVKGGGLKVVSDVVKTNKKSLAILGGADGDGVGVPLDTKESATSVEFWVYIKGGGRSFNIKITSADNIATNDGGTYINWDADIVRLYDGAAWNEIGAFETDKWKYVRVVADFQKSEFDFYSGDSREAALNAKPEKGLKFRKAAFGPAAKWVVFYVWAMSQPGYVDDLLVYEGDTALVLSVEPAGKLATVWGEMKRR